MLSIGVNRARTQGDMNNDGTVDSVDLQMLIQLIVDPETASVTESIADLNNDGKVDSLDALILVKKITE